MQTYTPTGKQTTPTITGLNNPQGVAVAPNGKIYIVNYAFNAVWEFSPTGKVYQTTLKGLDGPAGIAIH
jgi:DNA-binding beta-propeller fold protein YncE